MKKTPYVGSGRQQDFIKMLNLRSRYVNRIKGFETIKIFVQIARYHQAATLKTKLIGLLNFTKKAPVIKLITLVLVLEARKKTTDIYLRGGKRYG